MCKQGAIIVRYVERASRGSSDGNQCHMSDAAQVSSAVKGRSFGEPAAMTMLYSKAVCGCKNAGQKQSNVLKRPAGNVPFVKRSEWFHLYVGTVDSSQALALSTVRDRAGRLKQHNKPSIPSYARTVQLWVLKQASWK